MRQSADYPGIPGRKQLMRPGTPSDMTGLRYSLACTICAVLTLQALDTLKAEEVIRPMETFPRQYKSDATPPEAESTDYGVVQKRHQNHRGWRDWEPQDCARPKRWQAGEAKQLCNQITNAQIVKEYSLHFGYIPDDDPGRYPFGVFLDFALRLNRIESEPDQISWQVQLASVSQASTLVMYRRELDEFPDQKRDDKSQTLGQTTDFATKLAHLQEELELEAYQFLQKYLFCLRRGEEACGESL